MNGESLQREQFKEVLKRWLTGADKLVVLGVGNELRGEDAAGILVARILKRFNGERFEALECGVSVEECLDHAFGKKPSHLLIIDAFPDGGRLMLLDPSDLESRTPVSTHAVPLPLLLEALGKPADMRVKILGVGVESFELGSTVSGELLRIVGEIAGAISEAAALLGLLGPEQEV